MITKLKFLYNENKMWLYLAKYILISFLLAVVAILIDIKFIPILEYIPEIFLTSVDLAKVILGTLSGSLLTITTFTFSTIMVVLTMYASNFSPRVVNNFLTDKITMKVLGIFVGGFIYCILALFFMRKAYSSYLVVSATIAILYSILCIIYFVIFVYNVSSSIQATKLISRLYDESYEIINNSMDRRGRYSIVEEYEVGEYVYEDKIISNNSGYLINVDFNEILHDLRNEEAKLVIDASIGDFISKNQLLGTLHHNMKLENNDKINDIEKSFNLEEERIDYNDYRFSIQKIIDITLRAISPGINDPNTAIHCINILGVILGELSTVEGKYISIEKENTDLQILFEDFNFKEDLYFTFYQIVHYGKEDISIMLAVFNALKTINRASTNKVNKEIEEFGEYVYFNCIHNFKHRFDIEIIKKAKDAIIL